MSKFSIKRYREDYESIFNRVGSSTQVIEKYKQLPNLNIDFDVYLPDYKINLQRDFVWSLEQQQEFILSIFKKVYLTPVSVVVNDTSDNKVYQVIDGKQRISTIIAYLNNKFPVKVDKDSIYYNDLDQDSKITFGNQHLLGYILYTSEDFDPLTDLDKIKWFEYINFIGTPQDKLHQQKLKELINI